MEKGMSEITDIVFSETKEVEEEERESVGAEGSGGEDEKNGGGGGGIIISLISNLVAPLSPKVRDHVHHSTSPEETNGGPFNSFISGILHRTGGEDEREGPAAADERKGGGGLIDSHLPASPADDATLATDEASILIHSIVHD